MRISKYHADAMLKKAEQRLEQAEKRRHETWWPCARRRLAKHIATLGTTVKTSKATAGKVGLLALFFMTQMAAQRSIFSPVPKRWQKQNLQGQSQQFQQLQQVPQVPRERG